MLSITPSETETGLIATKMEKAEKANSSLLTTIAGSDATSDTEEDKQDSSQRKNIKLN